MFVFLLMGVLLGGEMEGQRVFSVWQTESGCESAKAVITTAMGEAITGLVCRKEKVQ